MDKQMIFDPDHLSVLRAQAGARPARGARATRASSPATAGARPTPTRASTSSAASSRRTPATRRASSKQWKALKPMRDQRFYWGIGYGADMNGFGAPGRAAHRRAEPGHLPVQVLRRQADDRQAAARGERVCDINVDGVAHYGLYPRLGRGPAQASAATRSSTTWRAAPRPTCRCGSAPTACRPPVPAGAGDARRGLTRMRIGARRGALAPRRPAVAAAGTGVVVLLGPRERRYRDAGAVAGWAAGDGAVGGAVP